MSCKQFNLPNFNGANLCTLFLTKPLNSTEEIHKIQNYFDRFYFKNCDEILCFQTYSR